MCKEKSFVLRTEYEIEDETIFNEDGFLEELDQLLISYGILKLNAFYEEENEDVEILDENTI